MKPCFVLSSLALAALAACAGRSASSPATLDPSFNTFNGARVEVVQQGGFAALAIRRAVNHDDRSYVATTRRICTTHCGVPTDSASGMLTLGATDSLFAAIVAQDPFSLKDDYGVTKGGADMFTYTVRLTVAGKVKSVRFDDGTMPEPMQKILLALQTTLFAARR